MVALNEKGGFRKEDFPPSLIDAICVHEAFRRLGYLSEEIFLVLYQKTVVVQLHAEGKQFLFEVGPLEHDHKIMRAKWTELLGFWNEGGNMTEDQRQDVWKHSLIARNTAPFLVALAAKGFTRWKGKEGKI